MVKRACLYLNRKYKRGLLLLFLLLLLSFSISVGICKCNSINDVVEQVQKNLGTSFLVKLPNYIQNPDYSGTVNVESQDGSIVKVYAGPKLNKEVANEIMKIQGIERFNADKIQYIHFDNVQLIPGLSNSVFERYDLEHPQRKLKEMYTRVTKMYGNTDTELCDLFRSGSLSLMRGAI